MGHYFINDSNLKTNIKKICVFFKQNKFVFNTDNGVFSKSDIDYGTRLLIETVLDTDINGLVLDLGCGYGPIGIVLNKIKKVIVDMIDINERAICLANLNIQDNVCKNINAFVNDGFKDLERKYNYIVSNPPIRVGKKVLYSLMSDAKKYLLDDGIIYLVIRKEQGAKSFIKDFSYTYKIDILNKSKGFYIISLKKN